MTTANLTGTDVRLRDAVIRQLDWDPDVDDSAIGVSAKAGVVTLTGFIGTYAGKLAAERAVRHHRGVRVVANDLVVRLKVDRTDTDIADDIARALRLRPIPEDVQATVRNGHVTLTGRVEWFLQKAGPEEAVRHVTGVRGVVNRITVSPATVDRDVRRRIMQALHRNADLDARQISVAVSGDIVTLSGTVKSWSERDAADRAAGSALGIVHVENQLIVEPQYYEPDDVVVDPLC